MKVLILTILVVMAVSGSARHHHRRLHHDHGHRHRGGDQQLQVMPRHCHGGETHKKPVDDEIRVIVSQVESDIRLRACGIIHCRVGEDGETGHLSINGYTTQLVAGTLYKVCVTVDGAKFQATIFSQPWTDTLDLEKVEGPILGHLDSDEV